MTNVVDATMGSLQITSLDEAAYLLKTAKKLEADAESYRQAARKFIIQHSGPEVVGWEPDPKGAKTILYKSSSGVIALTRPTKKAVPAHFDQDRTEEFRAVVNDLFPEWVEAVFRETITYTFDEAAWIACARMTPERAEQMHTITEKYIVPEVPEEPMSERVEVK